MQNETAGTRGAELIMVEQMLDGAKTLEEAASLAEDLADYLRGQAILGKELVESVMDGMIVYKMQDS